MLGIGIMLFTTMFITTMNSTAKFISVAGIIYLSVMALLTPNLLIGMCMMETEQCRIVTLPALNIISIVSIVIGIIYVVLLIKEKRGKENGND
jgi:glucan phosphoethanolaminetransferase (alkaline phosphatase superfamily)